MRVALVSGYDLAVPGGVQTQVSALAAALVRRGEEVALIAPVTGSPESRRRRDDLSAAGVELQAVGRSYGLRANGSVAPVAPTPAAAAATRRALSHLGPDVVHVHEPLLPGPPLAAVLSSAQPVVATFHRADSDAWYRAEGKLLGPLVARRLDASTAVSQAAAATAQSVLGRHLGRVSEVRNGVDVARYESAREEAGRRRASLAGPYKNGERPTVVYVGRHEPRKGVGVLVDAAARLGPDVDVVVAGDGPEHDSLRRQAEGLVALRFPGRLDDDDQAELVASADVLVAPAVGGESFGLVLLEAMAAGTCVVASDIPGYRLAAAGAACLVPPGDPVELASSVRRLLDDPTGRGRYVDLGLERARACAIDTVAGTYAEIYAEAAEAYGRSRAAG